MTKTYSSSSLDKLWQAVTDPEVEVLSFDFFDTLFVRTVIDPEDVFKIIGRKIGVEDFFERRREAQTRAFVTMQATGRNEISLADIYAEFSLPGFDPHELMALELAIEKEVALPNFELLPLFLEATSRNIKTIIVSDMYLPLEYFQEVLQRFDLPQVDIYVSCDVNATKRDYGELFDKIVNILNVPSHNITHIGDNLKSDFERATERGWKAIHYVSNVIPTVVKSSSPIQLEYSIGRGLLKKNLREIQPDTFAAMGYHYTGPAAVAFYEWVKSRSVEDGVSHILLMARDGYVIDKIRHFDPNPINLPISYLLGSRTAFSLASITENNFADYIPFLMSGSAGLCVSDLLARVNVREPDPLVLQDIGLGADTVITSENAKKAEEFLWSLRWQILRTCQENRRGLFALMNQLGVSVGSKVAMVDIGWNGTTQASFECAIRDIFPLDVRGYYMALTNKPECLERRKKLSMRALFDATAAETNTATELYENRVAVEFLFSAPHNSVISLVCGKDNSVSWYSDPRRQTSDFVQQSVQAVVSGAEKFASDFYHFVATIGVKPDYNKLLDPLLAFSAGGAWKQDPLLDAIIDFDDWGMSSVRSVKMTSY